MDLVQCRHDSIVIKKDGKPVAALVDARLHERIRRMQERFDALCERLAQDFSQVPESEGMAAIDAAASAVRRGMQAQAGVRPGLAKPKAVRPHPQSEAKPAVKVAKGGKRAA